MKEREALKKMYQLLLTEPHAPTVCEQLERIAREALAQPEQEPVAFYVYKPTLPQGHLGNVSDGDLPWVYDQDPSSGFSARMLVTPVTSPPPQRKPWVGLTNEEKADLFEGTAPYYNELDYADAIEAKLKEKNA